MSRLINIVAVIATLSVVMTYMAGVIEPHQAFFLASTLIAIYTGYQFAQRDGMKFKEAFIDIFMRPSTYPRLTAYGSFVVSLGVGLLVVAQTLVV